MLIQGCIFTHLGIIPYNFTKERHKPFIGVFYNLPPHFRENGLKRPKCGCKRPLFWAFVCKMGNFHTTNSIVIFRGKQQEYLGNVRHFLGVLHLSKPVWNTCK